jgi:hypothetical protein
MHPRSLLLVISSLAVCASLASSCGQSTCSNIGGNYSASFTNNCGAVGSGMIAVAQAGCNVTIAANGLASGQGSIDGNKATLDVSFSPPCTGMVTAVGTIEGSMITGTFQGSGQGGSGCCTGALSGSFSMAKQP